MNNLIDRDLFNINLKSKYKERCLDQLAFESFNEYLGLDNKSAWLKEFEEENESISKRDEAIIAKSDAEMPPFRYICSLEILSRKGPKMAGTGTLVGPQTVLTVAHNVVNIRDGRLVNPNKLQVTPGRAGTDKPFGKSLADKVILNPHYNFEIDAGSCKDFAIIHLSKPLGIRVGFWSQRPRPSFDSRGSSIGAILGWRPGRFKVNFSGYPLSERGFQDSEYVNTVSPRSCLLFFAGIRSFLYHRVRQFKQGLKKNGINLTANNYFPIQTIRFPSKMEAVKVASCLRSMGIWVVLQFGPPDYQKGAVIRFVITSLHNEQDINKAVEALCLFNRNTFCTKNW